MSDALKGEAQVRAQITSPSSPMTTMGVLVTLHERCGFFLHMGPNIHFEVRFFLGSHAELVCDRCGLWWVIGDEDPITNMGQLGARLAALGYPAPKR